MKVYDLKVDNDNNLVIENGDFVVGDSTNEHAYAILGSNKGDFRNNIAIGADLNLELNAKMDDNFKLRLNNRAKDALEIDGYDTYKAKIEIDDINRSISLSTEAERIRK